MVSIEEEQTREETRVRLECATGADPSEEIFHLAVARGWVLRQLAREALSLEDVFVDLTRHDEAAAEPPADAAAAAPPAEEKGAPA